MSKKAIPAEAFEHGDPRRYRRGCRCRACTDGISAESRKRKYLRSTGREFLRQPDRAAAHIGRLRAAGMTDASIREAAAVCPDVFYRILRQEGRIHHAVETRVLRVPVPESATERSGAYTSALATVRRLRALATQGWTAVELGRRLGKDKTYVSYLQRGSGTGQVRLWVENQVRDLYEQLQNLKPENEGVTPSFADATRKRAAANMWAGPGCWDDDTITDPNAIAEWTGYCGTDRGWHIHRAEQLPQCQPCIDAHQVWLDANASLKGRALVSELARIRARYAGREAAIAENARDLLRTEPDIEIVAARLGVQSNRLYTALKRHPAPDTNAYEEAA